MHRINGTIKEVQRLEDELARYEEIREKLASEDTEIMIDWGGNYPLKDEFVLNAVIDAYDDKIAEINDEIMGLSYE